MAGRPVLPPLQPDLVHGAVGHLAAHIQHLQHHQARRGACEGRRKKAPLHEHQPQRVGESEDRPTDGSRTARRRQVIVAGIAVFRNPIPPVNAIASAVAIAGTWFYSRAEMVRLPMSTRLLGCKIRGALCVRRWTDA